MMKHTQFGMVMAVAWIAGIASGPAEGAIVTSPADSGPGTLREAMAVAATGETISFDPGVTSIALTSGELSFGGKALTIDGGGNVMIDAGGASRIFNVSGNDTVSTVKGLTLVNGSSTANGGGIVFGVGNDSVLIVSNCTISACSALNGGGIYAEAGNNAPARRLIVEDCLVAGNEATTGNGGGIFSYSVLELRGTVVSNNTTTAAKAGGGVYLSASAAPSLWDDVTLVDNAADNGGGGICWRGDKLVLSETRFRGNLAANSDALHFYSYDTPFMTVSNCTFEGRTGAGQRLARFQGPALLYGCTFNSHTGVVAAVGIENGIATTSRVVNRTFTGLANTGTGNGGALAAINPGALEFYNTTIFGNTCANKAGGLAVGKADLSLYSTIIAGNEGTAGAKDIWLYNVTLNTLDHCIYQELDGTADTSADNLVGDPKLEPLADNGGPTRTLAIQRTSPCRDAGANPLGLAFDQRGVGHARAHNLVADIGAYEFIPENFGSTIIVR